MILLKNLSLNAQMKENHFSEILDFTGKTTFWNEKKSDELTI